MISYLVLVGLPARGKSFIAQKVSRYLSWLGVEAAVFNVGEYRRHLAGAQQPHSFFDIHNTEANRIRKEAATRALSDMIAWLKAPVLTAETPDSERRAGTPTSFHRKRNSVVLEEDGRKVRVAIYDATNSTIERRKMVHDQCQAAGIHVKNSLFLPLYYCTGDVYWIAMYRWKSGLGQY